MTISEGSNFSSCYPVNNTDRGTAEDTGHIKEIDCSRTEKSVVVQSDSRSHALYDGIAQEVQCCTSNEDSSSDEDTESAPYDGTANDETTEEVQCCTSSEDSASDEDTESAPYDGTANDETTEEVQCCTSSEDSTSDEDTESAPYDGTANDETTEEVQCCSSKKDSSSDEGTENLVCDGTNNEENEGCSNSKKLTKEVKRLKFSNAKLQKELSSLKDQMAKYILSPEALQKDPIKLKLYTGLPDWTVFSGLLMLVAPAFPEKTSSKLSAFQRNLMFLMKVQLNLHDEDLAYRFNVHNSTVSRNFHRVLDVMDIKLKHLIIWPERSVLKKTMPTCFRQHFSNCSVIIDCTEIFIERPTNLLARAQCWSNYKHHSTVKFLIGITP